MIEFKLREERPGMLTRKLFWKLVVKGLLGYLEERREFIEYREYRLLRVKGGFIRVRFQLSYVHSLFGDEVGLMQGGKWVGLAD